MHNVKDKHLMERINVYKIFHNYTGKLLENGIW